MNVVNYTDLKRQLQINYYIYYNKYFSEKPFLFFFLIVRMNEINNEKILSEVSKLEIMPTVLEKMIVDYLLHLNKLIEC